MSKPLQYDSLLVHALAIALRKRCRGARVRSVQFDREIRTFRLVLPRRALVWNLDPSTGGLWQEPVRGPVTGTILPSATRVVDVRAAADDRLLEFAFQAASDDGDTRDYSLWVELLPNRRNVVLTSGTRVLASLQRLASSATGHVAWDPPEPRPRRGAVELLGEDEFRAITDPVEPARRRAVLLREIAWTSPINVDAFLGDAALSAEPQALADAYQRYTDAVARAGETAAVVLGPGDRDQPYPAALQGIPSSPAAELLQAFEEVAPAHRTAKAELDPIEIVRRLRHRRRAESGKLDRLRAEFDGAGQEALDLRRGADLLLGQLHRIERGQSEVVLEDWEGGRITLTLDPALDPAANANAMYEQARKRERAARRLPALIESARSRLDRLDTAIDGLESGDLDAASGAALLPQSQPQSLSRGRPERALPYRLYRTSSGLEVRVGRGSRANDQLTLRHSSPEDVWLHARDVAGAHVVLRWGRRDQNPSATDIAEAAGLAALHSRARTSGTVPVDWTRRKYVRKPRKAPPGRVVVERARTVFVEPNAELEERLRVD